MRYKLKPLTEIFVFKTPHMSMVVHSEEHYVGDAYFKIGDQAIFNNSPNKTRILFETDEYIDHNQDKWRLTSSELKIMIRMLLSPYRTSNATFLPLVQAHMNNWQAGMFIYNNFMCKGTKPFEYFAQLSRNDEDYDPKFIPIADVAFPHYEKLSRYPAFKRKG